MVNIAEKLSLETLDIVKDSVVNANQTFLLVGDKKYSFGIINIELDVDNIPTIKGVIRSASLTGESNG